MRYQCTLLFLLAAIAAGFCSAAVHAADDKDPQKTFDDVFGETYKKAVATPATDDDVELAKDLAKAVQTIDMPASLMQVIAGKMETLCEKAAGALLPTVDAMEKLAKADAKLKGELDAKIVALLEKAHASGDAGDRGAAATKLLAKLVPLADEELAQRKLDLAVTHYKQAQKLARETNSNQLDSISAKLSAATDLQKQSAEVDALEKKLEANPKDAESRKRLVHIHLIERNDPSAAVWFNGEGLDETTRKLLPVAAKNGAGAEPKVLADLGGWYLDLSNEASVIAKPEMLRNAKTYYDRFLEQHKENDLLKAKATLSLEQIAKKLKEAEGTAAAATPAATSTATNPSTPTTTTTPTVSKGAGELTVAIDGPTITDADRVERMFTQYSKPIAKEYVVIGSDYAPALDFDPKYPSSAGELVSAVTKRLTTTKEVRDGFIVRRVSVPPVPAEAEAVAMALPSFNQGAYGYIHSVEVVEVLGAEEMLVKNVWLVDPQSLTGVSYDERRERDKLRSRQDDFNFWGNTMKINGHPTAGVKAGDRVGMVGKGKPLQIIIVKTEQIKNGFRTVSRPIAAVTAKLTRGGLDEKQFEDLLTKRNLTHTDFVNIYLEAQRASARDAVKNTIARIEAKGARVP